MWSERRRPGHREAHVGEEPARAPLADVPLGVRVGSDWRGADDVEAELRAELVQLWGGHTANCASPVGTIAAL